MAGRRIERVNEQLRRELADLLLREVKDPRVERVTITRVSAVQDLSRARICVHRTEAGGGDVGEADVESLFEGLRAATSFLRGALGRRMRMRRVPELVWEWDAALDHAQRIERLLAEVRPDPTGDSDTGGTNG